MQYEPNWYVTQYARACMLYARTTGRNVVLFPKSLYIKPVIVPLSSYKNVRNLKLIFKTQGKYCSPPSEDVLHLDCIQLMRRMNWILVKREWDVIEDKGQLGKGDLVFKNGDTYCVIECKRKTNSKVYEQSRFYASAWKIRYASHNQYNVLYGIWTPKRQEILGIIKTYEEATELCLRDACRSIRILNELF